MVSLLPTKYGFRKVNIKKDEHIFYHPVFREDNKSQLHTIKRKRKGNGNNGSTFARGNSNMLGDVVGGGILESS